VAYAVDRLSRSQIHTAVLLDDIEKAGANLEFVTEDFENTAVVGMPFKIGVVL
jgi:DNA invertase Pin-like site-specific DNA recombinase